VRVYTAQQAGAVVRDPRALLYKTARNLVIDQARRSDVRTRFTDPQDDVVTHEPDQTLGPTALEPDTLLGSQQMVNAILTTIDSLPPRCRQAFLLHKFDGLSHADVAAHMGISIKMVEQHVRSAVMACKRCREEVDGHAPLTPPLRRRGGKHE